MTMAYPQRQAIHAYLNDTTHKAWSDWVEGEGVSITGMLEAIGRTIDTEPEAWEDFVESLGLVKKARRIDADRRRRGGEGGRR